MIRHIYLFRLKDKNRAREAAEKMLTLREHIPYMTHMEVGFDFRGNSNSYELCELCEFASMEDFKRFTDDPYHAGIREYMNGLVDTGVKIDYEI